jgi:dephospho-CoA kinase
MSLIYVTGISGSGKSEVLKELKARGYEAYGTDEDGISAFNNNETGVVLENPPTEAEDRTPEWRAQYTWKMTRERVEKLAAQSEGKLVFLLGVAANENEVWDLFSGVVALVIDEETLKQRIAERTNNNFGKVPHELENILEWQSQAEENYKKFGVTMVDATKPIQGVVDEVIEQAEKLAKSA